MAKDNRPPEVIAAHQQALAEKRAKKQAARQQREKLKAKEKRIKAEAADLLTRAPKNRAEHELKAAASQITLLVQAGNFFETACGVAGIVPATARRMLAKGADDERAGKNTWLAEFNRSIHMAMAKSEAMAVHTISQAGKDDWRATMALLERRNPRRWSPQVRVTVETELNELFAGLRDGLKPEVFNEVLRVAQAFLSGSGGESSDSAD